MVAAWFADDWNRDLVTKELSDAGIPYFNGTCPEIYNEKAFDQDGQRPPVCLANAHVLGAVNLAFLVHSTLTSADINRTCEALDNGLGKATH